MDTIETIHGALVQHGSHNDRIYLMRLNDADPYRLIITLEDLARQKGYGKIFARIPAPTWQAFQSSGYIKEAAVPGLFNGRTDGFFVAKYVSVTRKIVPDAEKHLEGITAPGGAPSNGYPGTGRNGPEIKVCQPADAEEIGRLYRQVFETYPFPIYRPAYLKRMMKEWVRYFGIRIEGRSIAVAAAEIHQRDQNAEMTDFATLPCWRGKGLAGGLLRHMDAYVRTIGIKTAFTIARAASPGMNTVFRKNGYRFAGLLRNNTQISGKIESMNVWYKQLDRQAG
jgi:beta-lysine N6-acetyltransferase